MTKIEYLYDLDYWQLNFEEMVIIKKYLKQKINKAKELKRKLVREDNMEDDTRIRAVTKAIETNQEMLGELKDGYKP